MTNDEWHGIVQFVVRHGYPILFAAVFTGQAGLPVPAPGFLLAAGALAASGRLGLLPALGLAVAACVLADWLWYEAGRAWGGGCTCSLRRLQVGPVPLLQT